MFARRFFLFLNVKYKRTIPVSFSEKKKQSQRLKAEGCRRFAKWQKGDNDDDGRNVINVSGDDEMFANKQNSPPPRNK